MKNFNTADIHSSWRKIIQDALSTVDPTYLELLYHDAKWLPGPAKIFNAFTVPLKNVNYILFGESPYPRAQSANGYAFWDNAVLDLWSPTGLSIAVNRATSLRNIMKMLLIAEDLLPADSVSQLAIAKLNKSQLVQTAAQLFNNFLQKGFLLWNASLVLSSRNVKEDAKKWYPFIDVVLNSLRKIKPEIELILWGKIANQIDKLPVAAHFKKHYSEHPYNLSFIHNQAMLKFFRPLKLLQNNCSHKTQQTLIIESIS